MRRRAPALAGALLVVLAGPITPETARGQAVEGPLSPAGRLRVEVSGLFWSHDARFGLHREGGRAVEAVEPLGFDLTRRRAGSELLPGLAPLEGSLRDALEDPAFRVSVGRSRARIRASRITLPVRADVGVTEWLTLGVTVPFVRRRSEVTFLLDADSTTANLGLNPRFDRGGEVTGFTEAMTAAIEALRSRAEARCDGRDVTASECERIDAALDQARSLRDALGAAYAAGGLFPFRGSTAAGILTGRLETLDARFRALDVTGMPTSLPLATAPLGRQDFDAYLTEPRFGVVGDTLRTWQSAWEPGDVELHGAVRIAERTAAPDSAGVLGRIRYLLGAGALLRLGTGTPDRPERFTDLGSGDGQTDVEARLFGDVALGRVGLWGDARYGVQLEGTRVRRVAPPEAVLAPASLTRTLKWSPGDYLSLEAAPRFHLTPELAVAARYRFYRKDPDRYTLDGAGEAPDDPPLPSVDPALLERETEQSLHQLGVGLVYSTLRAARRDDSVRPVEIHARYRLSPEGSGGMTPRSRSIRVGLRLFWRLWGE